MSTTPLKDIYSSKRYLLYNECKDIEEYKTFVKLLLKEYPDMKPDAHWNINKHDLRVDRPFGIFVYPRDNNGDGRYGLCNSTDISSKDSIVFCKNPKVRLLGVISKLKGAT